jgi:hypothetical protein
VKGLAIIFTCALALVGGAVVWGKLSHPTYSYRYRLTITLEVDGKINSGSSVIEVTWKGGPEIGDVGPYHPSVRGQATFIDLGSRGSVIAVLTAQQTIEGPGYTVRWPDGVDTIFLAARAFGNASTNKELSELPRLKGERKLVPDNMPRLIWFPKLDDPMTARKLLVKDIPAVLDPTARLVDAYVEITHDPILITIDKRLPWYDVLKRPLGEGVIQIGYGFALTKSMFVGDGP